MKFKVVVCLLAIFIALLYPFAVYTNGLFLSRFILKHKNNFKITDLAKSDSEFKILEEFKSNWAE